MTYPYKFSISYAVNETEYKIETSAITAAVGSTWKGQSINCTLSEEFSDVVNLFESYIPQENKPIITKIIIEKVEEIINVETNQSRLEFKQVFESQLQYTLEFLNRQYDLNGIHYLVTFSSL